MNIDFNSVPYRYLNGEQAVIRGEKIFCPVCHKQLSPTQFFKTLNLARHPSGYLPECKVCMTLLVDDSDPRTFLPILKEIDIPYVPSVWNEVLQKGASVQTGTIIGKYISKMKLQQYKKYHWVDSEELTKQSATKMVEGLVLSGKGQAEAEQYVKDQIGYDTVAGSVVIDEDKIKEAQVQKQLEQEELQNSDTPAMMAVKATKELTVENSKYGLTEEEILKLKKDWGADYSEDEFLQLEQLYVDMSEAYVIQDPIAVTNARIICKMTMKMNRFLDLDDIEAVSKLSRQLDLFIKTANLAPVQQKDRQQTTFAISQMAYLVEQEGGFVEQYYLEEPNDKLDMILRDMQDYTKFLIQGESNITEMVANAAVALEKENQKTEELLENYDEFAALEEEVMSGIEVGAEDEPIIMDRDTETKMRKEMVNEKNNELSKNLVGSGNAPTSDTAKVIPRQGRFGGKK